MNTLIIKLFNKAIQTQNSVSFKEMNEVAMKSGYIVHPDLCSDDVFQWLKSQQININTTFYKQWNDIISKNRFELYVDQITHYASTYGTNYTGDAYILNDGADVPDYSSFKVISLITKEEVILRCEKMLFSNVALKQETISDVLSILTALNHKVNIDLVRNKEAKMILYKETDQLPKEASEMVRYLVYLATGKSLLIKDVMSIESIKTSGIDVSLLIQKFGLKELSSVFYRYKPLLLAFKTNKSNIICINKLRRLAKSNHVPLVKGYFESLLSTPSSVHELQDKLLTLSNYKKIGLLQTILIRKKELANRAFVVRNQKLFIKEEKLKANKDYFDLLYTTIYYSLIHSVKSKACKIKLPIGVNLTLPVSEKSFIGNYPLGTSFDFSDSDNIIGIHWRGVDGAQDLDLKLIDIDGNQYGWNANYYNSNASIVFSGDMTSAHPEATELMYTTKGFKPAIVKCNLYNGESNSKFKFFIAKEKIVKLERNYMVNPNNIVISVDCEMDSEEKCLGVITENKFVLAQFRTGRGRVAGDSVTNQYTEYALHTLGCYLSLADVLQDAGFKITNESPDIDLTNLSKDSLLSLFS